MQEVPDFDPRGSLKSFGTSEKSEKMKLVANPGIDDQNYNGDENSMY